MQNRDWSSDCALPIPLKVSSRTPHRVSASLIGQTEDPGTDAPCLYDNVVYSRIFQILYRNEDIDIDDAMMFKVHLSLDGERVEEALSEAGFQLKLDLHFTDSELQLKDISAVPLISSRTLGLHFHPRRGLHHHVPVMFDYFHLSVISITVHASLIALHQPLTSFVRPVKTSWLGKTIQDPGSDLSNVPLENLVFGSVYSKPPLPEGSGYVPPETCIEHAYQWHRDLCLLLFSAYRGLGTYYDGLIKEIPDLSPMETDDLVPDKTLSQLCDQLQALNSPDRITEQIRKDLAWLCSQLLLMWNKFLEVVTLNNDVTTYLMQEHHTLRVRRFSEAFFYTEHEKPSSVTFQEHLIQSHNVLSSEVRSSEYLTSMPPLPVECPDIDGDWTSLPIIFEDRYVESPRKSNVPSKESKEKDLKDTLNVSDVTKRPQIIQTTTVYENALFEQTSPCIDILKESDVKKTSRGDLQEASEKTDDRTGCLEKQGDFSSTERQVSKQNIALVTSDSALTTNDNALMTSDSKVSHGGTTGVTYIEVKPCTFNQYRGEPVMIVNASLRQRESVKDSNSLQPKVEMDTGSKNLSFESIPMQEIIDSKSAPSMDNKRLHQSLHVLSKSNSTELVSQCLTNDLEMKSLPNGKHADFPMFSDVIKRSPSVISDSGIESEPSSVAWCDTRTRPMDVTSEKQLSYHLSGKNGLHRNSLEGGQTESNTSLPSGIQASLTSINSLPFEEEERDRELTKLTKSISAPQISSPDGLDVTPALNKSSEDNLEEANGDDGQNDLTDSRELCSSNVTEPCETPSTEITDQSFMSNSYSSLGNLFSEMAKVSFDEYDGYGQSPSPNVSFQEHEGFPEYLNNVPIPFSLGTSLDGESSQTSMAFTSPAKEALEGYPFLQEVELTEDSSSDHLLDNHSNSDQELYDTDQNKTGNRNACDLVSESHSSPSSVLALDGRRGVEMVNLSVSCTATCLPFSSVQKDTTAIPGFSAKQVLFPITRQPLGSFGEISVNSNGADDEINERMLSFYQAKEKFMEHLKFEGFLYSDLPTLASETPFFPPEEEHTEDGIHLVICVHGLDGNSADLRLVKTFLELGLPGENLDFLMSEKNQNDTFADFDAMTDRLIDEIVQHIQLYNLSISRISFIGHSLGNIIIRSVLTRPRFRYYLNKLHTFLSLSGPHLGTLYSNSTLVSTGLWLMQKLKKSGSLLQLTFRDNADLRKSFLYQLSLKPGLQYFKNVVLVASPQDRYVPFHSARIEMCKNAIKDKHTGPIYTEMVNNLLQPVIDSKDCTLIRHNVFHALPNTANTLIGRAAHIAVLDSELFLEKFFLVTGLNYFK